MGRREAMGGRARAPESGWLSSTEAARRLGIKRETLYAYVSRGMLARRKEAGSRESRFDPAEVARLAEGRRSGTGRPGALEVVIDSALTLLDPAGRLWYRAWDAEVAGRTASFEQVAEWLWTGSPADAAWGDSSRTGSAPAPSVPAWAPFVAPPAVLETGRRAAAALAATTPLTDRLRVAVAAAATADPLRFDRRPDAVAAAGRRIIAVLVDALPKAGGDDLASEGMTVAERLWVRLSPEPAEPERVAVLNTALVLLADHEMASSTLAARVAASTWADPYLVATAGLAALGGPLHGSVGDRAVPLLHEATARGASEVIGARWRLGEKIPGFGHMVYTNRDPRAEALLPLLQGAWPGNDFVGVTRDVIAVVTAHGDTFPNVDLMLAALVGAAGMAEGSAAVIFAVARTAGWLAHAIEEYEHALRYRLRAAYTGPAPGSGIRTPARAG
jgi:citrate synthase